MNELVERYDNIPNYLKREVGMPIFFEQLPLDWQRLFSFVYKDQEGLEKIRVAVGEIMNDLEYTSREMGKLYDEITEEKVSI